MSHQSSPASNECVSIRYDEVPSFLHNSAFYLQLAPDDGHSGMLEVPRTCFKPDDTVNDLEDLKLLLNTMIFWGIDVIPESILDFCHHHDLNMWQQDTLDLPDSGSLHNVLTECYDGTESILPAVNAGRPELVQHWLEVHSPENLTDPAQPCVEAASIGNLHLLKVLLNQNYPYSDWSCSEAAGEGHLDCLEYLHQQGCPWDENACSAAVESGHLDCLQYLHDNGCPWHNEDICSDAAEAGYLPCLRFAHEHGGILNERVTLTTDIDCLRYALEHNCPVHEYVHTGMNLTELSIEAVKLFQEHNVVWADDICTTSLKCPLEFTQHFIQHGCPCDVRIAHLTLWFGTPERLEYLIDDTLLQMSVELFSEAVVHGNVECVQALVDRGCPCNFACPVGHHRHRNSLDDARILSCVQYAAERSWPCSEDLTNFVFMYDLPLCQEYMRKEGIVDSTRESSHVKESALAVDSDTPFQR